MQSKNADYRVLHGVRVRIHPEDHPRPFLSERLRWQAVVENVEAAQKCLTAGDRSLYAALAECKAKAMRSLFFLEKLSGGPGVSADGERLPF